MLRPARLFRMLTPVDGSGCVAQDFEDRKGTAQQRVGHARGLHHHELAGDACALPTSGAARLKHE